MSAITSRHPVVKELLAVFGLESNEVSSFNLNINPGEAVTISAQFYVQDEKLGKVPGIIKRFNLIAVEEEEEAE